MAGVIIWASVPLRVCPYRQTGPKDARPRGSCVPQWDRISGGSSRKRRCEEACAAANVAVREIQPASSDSVPTQPYADGDKATPPSTVLLCVWERDKGKEMQGRGE